MSARGSGKLSVEDIRLYRQQYRRMKEDGLRPSTFVRQIAATHQVSVSYAWRIVSCPCYAWADVVES